MVQFEQTGYTISVHTGMNPVEEWQELQAEILSVLAALDTEANCMPMPYRLLNLMREMQPDLQVAKRMVTP